MREFDYDFKEGLTKALRASDDNPRNSQVLVKAYNVFASRDGLLAYEPLVNPITDAAGVVGTWPHPQIFVGKEHTLLLGSDKIYSVDSNWNLTEKISGLNAVDIWDVADYHDFMIDVI